MTDDLFLKYPYQDEEDFLTECDCCQSADEKCDFIKYWFYTQDDFEDYIDEVDYLMGLPNDEETVIRSNGLLYLHDFENNVCTLLSQSNSQVLSINTQKLHRRSKRKAPRKKVEFVFEKVLDFLSLLWYVAQLTGGATYEKHDKRTLARNSE